MVKHSSPIKILQEAGSSKKPSPTKALQVIAAMANTSVIPIIEKKPESVSKSAAKKPEAVVVKIEPRQTRGASRPK